MSLGFVPKKTISMYAAAKRLGVTRAYVRLLCRERIGRIRHLPEDYVVTRGACRPGSNNRKIAITTRRGLRGVSIVARQPAAPPGSTRNGDDGSSVARPAAPELICLGALAGV